MKSKCTFRSLSLVTALVQSKSMYDFSYRIRPLCPHPLQCMSETWYLACDMQMFLVSPLFIYLLWRWRKIGIAWSFVNILAYIGGTIAIYAIWDLPAMPFFTRPYGFKLNFIMLWRSN